MPGKYDILIAGAGFAGSLTALVLHNSGFKVCLVERERHPRFAIGESSTPVADMILRSLSAKYNLPWLQHFSRYGSWQHTFPQVICGIKRGFSYYKHYPGQPFTTDENHANELLVAASASDTQSDTNWLRSDIDAFIVEKVKEAGIAYYDETEITGASKKEAWVFEATQSGNVLTLDASFFIDATGGSALLKKIAGVESSASDFHTDSFAVFSHFNGVPRWMEMLQEKGFKVDDYPYNPDNSALHQVLDEGWVWMLRFNTGLTSIGFALDRQYSHLTAMPPEQLWPYMCNRYPSVKGMIGEATLAVQPGRILKSGRLQRKLHHCYGEGWVALPHTCGFIDPLFSSGIAHSLTGIERIVTELQTHWGDDNALHNQLEQYEATVFAELKITDLLVAGCYKTMKHFHLFNTWSMLYFAATIVYEQRRLQGQEPGCFLSADNAYIKSIIEQSYLDLMKILEAGQPSVESMKSFEDVVRERIKPVNTAGLMEPSSKNMYRHTTAVL